MPVAGSGGRLRPAASRYQEEKRVVFHKNVGPLISMQEMTRCIHCTRCVRFGQEIAGMMELGMANRGMHSEIQTFVGRRSIPSCRQHDRPVPGRRADLEAVPLQRPHLGAVAPQVGQPARRLGANLIVQVKNTTGDARAAVRERGRQRVLDVRRTVSRTRRSIQRRAPDAPMIAGTASGARSMERRARLRRHGCERTSSITAPAASARWFAARHGRGTVPAAEAGCAARQREHRFPPAPRAIFRRKARRRPWLGMPIAAAI